MKNEKSGFLGVMGPVPCEEPRTTFNLWVEGVFVVSLHPGKACGRGVGKSIFLLPSKSAVESQQPFGAARPPASSKTSRSAISFASDRSRHTIHQCRPMPFAKAGQRPTRGMADRQRAAGPFRQHATCNQRGVAMYTAHTGTMELAQETTSKHA